MSLAHKQVRQSVTLDSGTARAVKSLAKAGHTTASRVIAELIDRGLEAKAKERQVFLELADRLARTKSPSEQKRIKKELARLTFGT